MIDINITLKILGAGYKNLYQAKILIYDSYQNLIYNDYSYNGIVNVFLKKNNVYRIIIKLYNYILITSIYVYKENIFIFNIRPVINSRIITFHLKDHNYDNLPIMKGEILLG